MKNSADTYWTCDHCKVKMTAAEVKLEKAIDTLKKTLMYVLQGSPHHRQLAAEEINRTLEEIK